MSVNYSREIVPESGVGDAVEDQRARNEAALRLLDAWGEPVSVEDAEEQRETWEHLRRTLDENRTSRRELFPSA